MTDTQDTPASGVAQRLRDSERLSIKAVMVEAGEDPLPLLRKAGITEFLSVPVALAPGAGTTAAFGGGFGSSITATWEPDQADEGHASPAEADAPGGEANDGGNSASPLPRPRPVNLPGAFGMRPVAPIDRDS